MSTATLKYAWKYFDTAISRAREGGVASEREYT
jgi:hypothetical protein